MRQTLIPILTATFLLSGCGVSMLSNNAPQTPGEIAYKTKVIRWSTAGVLLFVLSGAASQGGNELFK